MASRIPNPIRDPILWIGLGLAKLGIVDERRVRRTTDLAWPRIVTGLARMSKSAVDVAMVGIAVGSAAIAGVGFAGPFWGLAFVIGGGLATGTIALVSQRYGAEAYDQLGQAVRTSALTVFLGTLPLVVVLWTFPAELIALLSNDPAAIEQGAAYLKIIALGIPFGALNLVGGRILIGADDAWTPMVLRASGAVVNIVLNAVLIFGFGMGVVGAALGTVLANIVVTAAFLIGLLAGGLPRLPFPVSVSWTGRYADVETIGDLVRISLPVMGRNSVWVGSRFPLYALLALFGSEVVAAYVIAMRVWGLMNTPGWGFGLATSSLVGQSIGEGDTTEAERYSHDIAKISVTTYTVGALFVFVFAVPIIGLFISEDAGATTAPVAVDLVRAACIAVVARGVTGTYSGALDASGDTTWTFYAYIAGMFGFTIPVVFLGAMTPLGLWGLYLSFFGQSVVPAIVNYYRFSTGEWKRISEQYRPEATPAD